MCEEIEFLYIGWERHEQEVNTVKTFPGEKDNEMRIS